MASKKEIEAETNAIIGMGIMRDYQWKETDPEMVKKIKDGLTGVEEGETEIIPQQMRVISYESVYAHKPFWLWFRKLTKMPIGIMGRYYKMRVVLKGYVRGNIGDFLIDNEGREWILTDIEDNRRIVIRNVEHLILPETNIIHFNVMGSVKMDNYIAGVDPVRPKECFTGFEAMQKVQDDITEWSAKTFDQGGGISRAIAVINHLEEEVGECRDQLKVYLDHGNKESHFSWEYADCMILLLESAKCAGLDIARLMYFVDEKMKINKKRKWGDQDKNGVIHHIPEEALPKQTKHTITFYREGGTIIGVCPLMEGSDHADRVLIAKENDIQNWHHYTLHDAGLGMKKGDKSKWYQVDLETGKIIELAIDNSQDRRKNPVRISKEDREAFINRNITLIQRIEENYSSHTGTTDDIKKLAAAMRTAFGYSEKTGDLDAASRYILYYRKHMKDAK